jgi:hypothetical protein
MVSVDYICYERKIPLAGWWMWMVADVDLVWERWMVAGVNLVWEKSTVGMIGKRSWTWCRPLFFYTSILGHSWSCYCIYNRVSSIFSHSDIQFFFAIYFFVIFQKYTTDLKISKNSLEPPP